MFLCDLSPSECLQFCNEGETINSAILFSLFNANVVSGAFRYRQQVPVCVWCRATTSGFIVTVVASFPPVTWVVWRGGPCWEAAVNISRYLCGSDEGRRVQENCCACTKHISFQVLKESIQFLPNIMLHRSPLPDVRLIPHLRYRAVWTEVMSTLVIIIVV